MADATPVLHPLVAVIELVDPPNAGKEGLGQVLSDVLLVTGAAAARAAKRARIVIFLTMLTVSKEQGTRTEPNGS